jgi:hypothetical protein
MILSPVAIVVAACSTGTSGSPSPSPTTASAPTSRTSAAPATTASRLASIDPCSLLDPAIIAKNNMTKDQVGAAAGARYCSWQDHATATDLGFLIGINIYDAAGLDQLSTAGFTVTNYSVGQHQGRLSKDTVDTTCAVSIGVTSTSRVDVVGIDGANRGDVSCQLAKSVAPSVERKLPVGG